jgi:nucleoside-triphosphatase
VSPSPVRLLISGRPGAGKTTVLSRLSELLREAGVPVSGFLTRERRQRGRRVGFEIETFEGVRGVLAHVELPGPPRVGRYGVDLETFEALALPAIKPPGEKHVVLVDELGKMELASTRFREATVALFDDPVPIVASVQTSPHPFTARLKGRADVEILPLTPGNRDRLPGELAQRLRAATRIAPAPRRVPPARAPAQGGRPGSTS